MSDDARKSPPVRDSDLMYLCIRQLERCAERMANYDYGPELDRDLARAAEWFEWAADSIDARRVERDGAVPTGSIDPSTAS